MPRSPIDSTGREAGRVHANTCSMIIPPVESLLGNVIHHARRHQRRTRGEGIDRWMTEDCSHALVVYPAAGFNKRGNGTAGSPPRSVSGPSHTPISARSCRSGGGKKRR